MIFKILTTQPTRMDFKSISDGGSFGTTEVFIGFYLKNQNAQVIIQKSWDSYTVEIHKDRISLTHTEWQEWDTDRRLHKKTDILRLTKSVMRELNSFINRSEKNAKTEILRKSQPA